MKLEVTLHSCSSSSFPGESQVPISVLPLDKFIKLLEQGIFGNEVSVTFKVNLGSNFCEKHLICYTITADNVRNQALLEGLLSDNILRGSQEKNPEK